MILKIISAIVLLLVAFMFHKNNSTPSYIGMHDGKFSDTPQSPNAVSTQTTDQSKKIQPIPFTTLEEAKARVKRTLVKMGQNAIHTENESYMHIVFTTPTLKYKDDVEISFDLNEHLIHYRSQSRIGYSDAGLNRKRFNEFTEQYQASSK